jgi:hypothetical protein
VNVSAKPLHIDIPVKMTDVKVVFSIGALSFEGDLPASIFHMQLIENDVEDWKAKSEVIAEFLHERRPCDVARHRVQCRPEYSDRQSIQGSCRRPGGARRANRTMRRYREGSRLGQRRSASGRKGQHGRHGENDATRPGRILQDLGIGSKVFAKPKPKARLASFLPTTQADRIKCRPAGFNENVAMPEGARRSCVRC